MRETSVAAGPAAARRSGEAFMRPTDAQPREPARHRRAGASTVVASGARASGSSWSCGVAVATGSLPVVAERPCTQRLPSRRARAASELLAQPHDVNVDSETGRPRRLSPANGGFALRRRLGGLPRRHLPPGAGLPPSEPSIDGDRGSSKNCDRNAGTWIRHHRAPAGEALGGAA